MNIPRSAATREPYSYQELPNESRGSLAALGIFKEQRGANSLIVKDLDTYFAALAAIFLTIARTSLRSDSLRLGE
jgi:hypothetical protein